LDEFRDGMSSSGFGCLPDPYMLGLSTWLSLGMVGLAVY